MSVYGHVVLHLFSQELSLWSPTDVLTAAQVGEEPVEPCQGSIAYGTDKGGTAEMG